MFGSRQSNNYLLHHNEECELGQILHKNSYEKHDLEEGKDHSNKSPKSDDNNEEGKECTDKDIIIKDLKKKLDIEKEVKQNYQNKNSGSCTSRKTD